ncbi:hypothetical protein FB45DRAFT_361539 [Roridomyces roridus]|uniref:DUF1688-domain-containing protein n=1 Tax=Roridomyces roridus TaxID=1738132 RepID=A0AAD7C8I7_9AGAR|nr:hypothetical protein FB45DRAFT_361539 [Roridomyces roridus]
MSLAGFTSSAQTAAYLRTLPAIRERCTRVFDLAKQGKLEYFEYHPEAEDEVTAFCVDIIQRDFGTDFAQIPPHGRWRHLDSHHERIAPLVAKWASEPNPPTTLEATKRLIDLFMVAVLLDAGAGTQWGYTEPGSGVRLSRSEGLGVAAVHMFQSGLFSGDAAQPYRVDAQGLAKLTAADIAAGLQVSAENPLVGLEGRASLLTNLASALRASSEFFGPDGRPGNLIDFLESQSQPPADGGSRLVPIAALWSALVDGLQPIWPPARTALGGVPLGDVWPCPALALNSSSTGEGDDLVPFHKLTGWLAYSLMEPLQVYLRWKFEGTEHMTGLPEYRNGGLFLDLGVLSLRSDLAEPLPTNEAGIPRVPPNHPLIVEWRAMTVILLDRTHAALRLALPAPSLSLAQVLESATWKGGREIAQTKRGGGGPPIDIVSDGTVF